VKSTIAQAATTPLTQMMASLALSMVVMIALWQSGNRASPWAVSSPTSRPC
jgi:subfamily B ATP-binding cassette protein MsbA